MTTGRYDYSSAYPNRVDLSPDSETHKKLLKMLLDRVRSSNQEIQARHSAWSQIDRSLTSYVPLDDEETRIKNQDPRKPVRIIVPTTFATLNVLLSYNVAAFLQSPIFRYEGWSSEDVPGTILLQRLVDMQVRRFKCALNLYTMWRDAFSYGVGPVAINMRTIKGYAPAGLGKRSKGFFSRLLPRERIYQTIFEGSDIVNIDPYNFLPDPNVPINEMQKGEFVGWVDRTNIISLVRDEADGYTFNAKYVKDHYGPKTSQYFTDPYARHEKTGQTERHTADRNQQVDVIHIYVDLIPKDWGLSLSEEPEKWLFDIAGDKIITRAERLEDQHGMFPIAVDVPNFDGHSVTPTSILETSYGLQQTIDWMFTSHISNVRKAINDMLIVDPYMVNMNDLANPEEGKLIRLRRQAWGRGVDKVVQQLKVSDITRGHVDDIMTAMNLMDLTSGAVDVVKGVRRNTSERVSATEAQGTMNSALSRLETSARISALQSLTDIAMMMASNTQQYMSKSQEVKLIGEFDQQLLNEYGLKDYEEVDPGRLQIMYDVMAHDGTVPTSTDTQSWVQLFQVLSASPELAQRFDMVRIFTHIARGMGARNVNDFVKKGGGITPSTMDPASIEEEVRKGNLYPMTIGGPKV